jgi:hypothetical protein
MGFLFKAPPEERCELHLVLDDQHTHAAIVAWSR